MTRVKPSNVEEKKRHDARVRAAYEKGKQTAWVQGLEILAIIAAVLVCLVAFRVHRTRTPTKLRKWTDVAFMPNPAIKAPPGYRSLLHDPMREAFKLCPEMTTPTPVEELNSVDYKFDKSGCMAAIGDIIDQSGGSVHPKDYIKIALAITKAYTPMPEAMLLLKREDKLIAAQDPDVLAAAEFRHMLQISKTDEKPLPPQPFGDSYINAACTNRPATCYKDTLDRHLLEAGMIREGNANDIAHLKTIYSSTPEANVEVTERVQAELERQVKAYDSDKFKTFFRGFVALKKDFSPIFDASERASAAIRSGRAVSDADTQIIGRASKAAAAFVPHIAEDMKRETAAENRERMVAVFRDFLAKAEEHRPLSAASERASHAIRYGGVISSEDREILAAAALRLRHLGDLGDLPYLDKYT